MRATAHKQACHVWRATADGPRRFECTVCGARCGRDPAGRIITFVASVAIDDDDRKRELGCSPFETRGSGLAAQGGT